ncbi:lytic transglycosylase domain-containing protein [Burkholderia cepacia]|uniref:lytic transglycosylase domain-containing protein n=1 Tax=Burkholderia cepacia TaxID=292 RepID=UPI002653BBF8|nr:lytic transglycosylase domain-containing protein [Burkholderia cepacia]MDN7900818.1 lytic transglycosylase domain-containing protein [Burkholderia cepacia]
MSLLVPTIRQIGLLISTLTLSCGVAHASCWEDAGSQYGIDPTLLKAIAWKESRGWTGARGPMLKDGNQAIGLMQINTVHLPTLARVGIQRRDLFDACTSQRVGAWVLANCIAQFGSTWKAVGCYNTGPASSNTAAQLRYVRDVQRYYTAYKQARPEVR